MLFNLQAFDWSATDSELVRVRDQCKLVPLTRVTVRPVHH